MLTGLAAHAESDAQIHRVISVLSGRLTGQVLLPTDPMRASMFSVLQGSGFSKQALLQATTLLTDHPGFTRFFLRDFFAVMLTLSRTTRLDTPLNNALVLMIAQAIQNRDVRPIFFGNRSCQVRRADNTLVQASSITEQQLGQINLKTALECVDGQTATIRSGGTDTRANLPEDQVMGAFTLDDVGTSTRSFAQQVFSGGTNLRFGHLLKLATWGDKFSLAALKRPDFPMTYYQVFVTLNPAGNGLEEAKKNCAGCHDPNGAMVPCYHWDHRDNQLFFNVSPNSNTTKCRGSTAGAENINPSGFFRRDDAWRLLFHASQNSMLGNRNADDTGNGLRDLGIAWTNFEQTWRYMVERTLTGANGVCHGANYSAYDIDNHVDSLMRNGDLVNVVVDIASDPICLGL